MRKEKKTILGVIAASPRMTLSAAFLLACGLSLPVFIILTIIGWGMK